VQVLTLYVPCDLLDGLSSVRHKRLVVAAWLRSGGDTDDDRALRWAGSQWAPERLGRPGRVSVLSILLELEAMGLCRVVAKVNGAVEVEVMLEQE
jgi:hypothetical protein